MMKKLKRLNKYKKIASITCLLAMMFTVQQYITA